MRQRPIDLLPDSIRARSQAGVVTGRYIVSVVMAVILLGMTATHSRLMLDLARDRLHAEEKKADIVLSAEAKAQRLRLRRDETRQFIERYEKIALPLPLSRVVATITNMLPESASVDRIDLYAGPRKTSRSSRSRGASRDDGPQPREISGELGGFAKTDQDVAEIVAALDDIGLFSRVSLDFSRTRTVRGEPAREFRISFRSKLAGRYQVDSWGATREEAAHVE